MGAGLKAQAPVGLALLSQTAITASGHMSKAGPHGGAPSLSSVQGPAQVFWAPCGGGSPTALIRGQGGKEEGPMCRTISRAASRGARAQGDLRQV